MCPLFELLLQLQLAMTLLVAPQSAQVIFDAGINVTIQQLLKQWQ